MNVVAMGTCRITAWSDLLFAKTQVSNVDPNRTEKFTVFSSRTSNVNIYPNPTGYCTSPPEFLDLLNVLHRSTPCIDKNKHSTVFPEIHKYLPPNEILTNISYDMLLLEICSRRFLKAPDTFKEAFSWQGSTIPYKVMDSSFKNSFDFGSLDSLDRSNTFLSDEEVEYYLSEIMSIAQVPPSKVHILGNYVFNHPLENGAILPPSVEYSRKKMNNALSAASHKLGFTYHDFSKVLSLEKDASGLLDTFHLSPKGIESLSTHFSNLF
jgi:hypothetical protein